MADGGEPVAKKEKTKSDDILGSFHSKFEKKLSELTSAYNKLFYQTVGEDKEDEHISFLPVRFVYCNASQPVSFENSYCEVEFDVQSGENKPRKGLSFGLVFYKGMKTLHDFLKSQIIPEEKWEKEALSLLIAYICNEDEQEVLYKADWNSETDLTVLLLNHFFLKLIPSSKWLIDSKSKNKPVMGGCPCASLCEHSMHGSYGDTSIGNTSVWHGYPDAIIGGSLAVSLIDADPGSPGIRSLTEVKESSLPKYDNQLIAETVVFSFLQRMRHPAYSLIPTIGICNKMVIIYMYDSVDDVLLRTNTELKYKDVDSIPKLVTILAVWLAGNYKIFCSGLVRADNTKVEVSKSRFFEQVQSKLKTYQKCLHTKTGFASVILHTPVPKSVENPPMGLKLDL